MGHQKHYYEQGYTTTDSKFICTRCIKEAELTRIVSENSCNQNCSYCKKKTTRYISVCKLDQLVSHICRSIQSEWTTPENAGLYYDNENQEYVGDTYSTIEVLQDIDFGIENEEILEDIADAILDDTWCSHNPYSIPVDEEMISTWEIFTKHVMTRSRYFFNSKPILESKNKFIHTDSSNVLNYIGEIITQLDLFREVFTDQLIYRVRIIKPRVRLSTAREFGSPPLEYATLPNRMSPPGISMFYGAFDKKTAITETYIESNESMIAACGVFQPTRKLQFIDLSKREIPSIFDDELGYQRTQLSFLYDFINDFTKPIDRLSKPHVDYVPTQIVTEYLRDRFLGYNKSKIDGIMYPSSKSTKKNAVVIFADSDQCCDPSDSDIHTEQLLKLISTSRTRIPPKF